MSNGEKGQRHDGYSPSGRIEKGYQPTSDAQPPAPSSLPTTGSSVTYPESNAACSSSNGEDNAK